MVKLTGSCLMVIAIILNNTLVAQSMEPKSESIPNPASKKCIESGYELVPVILHGVPTYNYCVNPETGSKCEEWRYYRGECKLEPIVTRKSNVKP